MEKHQNTKHKQAGVAILVSNRVSFEESSTYSDRKTIFSKEWADG